MDAILASHVPKVGFCKLWGDGIEHYAKKYEIVIGRRSKTTVLDVVIGDNINISRKHAAIIYSVIDKAWQLHVYGKNGVTVKNTIHTPESDPVSLQSGDVLQFGDTAFFFLLEKGSRATKRSGKKRTSTAAASRPPKVPAPAKPTITATITAKLEEKVPEVTNPPSLTAERPAHRPQTEASTAANVASQEPGHLTGNTGPGQLAPAHQPSDATMQEAKRRFEPAQNVEISHKRQRSEDEFPGEPQPNIARTLGNEAAAAVFPEVQAGAATSRPAAPSVQEGWQRQINLQSLSENQRLQPPPQTAPPLVTTNAAHQSVISGMQPGTQMSQPLGIPHARDVESEQPAQFHGVQPQMLQQQSVPQPHREAVQPASQEVTDSAQRYMDYLMMQNMLRGQQPQGHAQTRGAYPEQFAQPPPQQQAYGQMYASQGLPPQLQSVQHLLPQETLARIAPNLYQVPPYESAQQRAAAMAGGYSNPQHSALMQHLVAASHSQPQSRPQATASPLIQHQSHAPVNYSEARQSGHATLTPQQVYQELQRRQREAMMAEREAQGR